MSCRSKPRSRLPYDGDPDTTAPRSLDRRSRNRDFANQVFGLSAVRDELTRWIVEFFYTINPSGHESLARDDSREKTFLVNSEVLPKKTRHEFLRLRFSALTSRKLADKNFRSVFSATGRWIFSSKKSTVSQAKAPQYRHHRSVGKAVVYLPSRHLPRNLIPRTTPAERSFHKKKKAIKNKKVNKIKK